MSSNVKIDDRVWKKLAKKLGKGSRSSVKVGVLSNKRGGQKHPDGKISMVELAAIHEFGSPAAGIPERSFIRSTIKDEKDRITKLTGKIAESIIDDKRTFHQGLSVLGTKVKDMIKNNVMQGAGISPSNSPATVALKGSSRPLVDTGRLIGAVDYQVVGTSGTGTGIIDGTE